MAGCEYSRFAKDWRYLGFLPFEIQDQFFPDLQGRRASVGPERFCVLVGRLYHACVTVRAGAAGATCRRADRHTSDGP